MRGGSWLVVLLLFRVGSFLALTINHTAGAAFVQETPLIIASAMETTWVSVPFPVVPAFNKTLLDLAFQEHQSILAKTWEEHDGKICGDLRTTEALINITYLTFKGIEYEIDEIEWILAEKRNRATTFVDKHEEGASRDKRWIKPALGGVAAAIILAPILKDGFCHNFSFVGLCGDSSRMDRLGEEASFLDSAVRRIVLESGEKLHILGHSSNKTQTQLKLTSHESNINFELFRGMLLNLVNQTDDQRNRKSACNQ